MCKEIISEGVSCLEARGQHFKALLQNKVSWTKGKKGL